MLEKKLWRNIYPEGHKLFFSGREDRHEHGVGFLIHKDTVNVIMECRPVSSRLITIRLTASMFNITIIQAYGPATDYHDDKIEDFYDQLQAVIDQVPKKGILVVQGDWNAKIGESASKNCKGICGQYCGPSSSSPYARWRCLLSSRRRLSSSAPPGCHRACPSVASVQAICPAS